jgi:hypothetical protein
MNPSFLLRAAALAAVAASTPLVSVMPGDAGQSWPMRAAHARRTDVTPTAARGTATDATDGDASERWQTIELPPPSRLDRGYSGVPRNIKVRT